MWAHTLELSSTLRFTLNSAEGPVPEWVGPVVSVCQNRWTLDPLSAFPAKQMTCLLLFFQPSFRLDIFRHFRASSHFAALPLRHKRVKTVSVGMDSYFGLGTSIFAFSTSVNPSRHGEKETTAEQRQDSSCVFEFKLFCLCSYWLPDMNEPSGLPMGAEPSMSSSTGTAPKRV